MPSGRQYQDTKQLGESPINVGDKLNPAHKLGAPLTNSDELRSNNEMGARAQGRATVHRREPGITGRGIGRNGRKGRTR